MGNYLNIGNDGFATMVKDGYVDKTGLISFINHTLGTSRKLTCVSRPRRFGKSFSAKMLCAYYDRGCDSRPLFQNLEIAKDDSFDQYLNKYDVLYLDITWFLSGTAHGENMVRTLQEKVIAELRETYPQAKLADTLPETLSAIHQETNKKFIVIIDEWDALFREEKDAKNAQKQYLDFLRALFKNSGFTDRIIDAAYITGILPIKKYGTQSAVSDFREYTMLSPGPLAKYIGFTEGEVKAICEKYDLSFDEMRHWYDGYSFRQMPSVYNPNSVMEAVNRRDFGSYWTRTETYESLRIYLDMNLDGLKGAVLQMLSGEKPKIMAGSFQNDMTHIKSKDDVMTLMVHLGYLAYDATEETVSIPNEEVRQEFLLAVGNSKHTEMAKLIQLTDKLLKQTLAMDEKAVASAIEEIHKTYASPKNYHSEEALRSTIHFAYLGCLEDFKRVDELPSGHGYADVVYIPKIKTNLPVLVIELKWNKSAQSAIRQVKNKDYPHLFQDYKGDILLVGVNYNEKTKKHTCTIEKIGKDFFALSDKKD